MNHTTKKEEKQSTVPKEWPPILTMRDCQRLFGWSFNQASRIFHRPDFPLIDREVKKNRQITRDALWVWMNREIKE